MYLNFQSSSQRIKKIHAFQFSVIMSKIIKKRSNRKKIASLILLVACALIVVFGSSETTLLSKNLYSDLLLLLPSTYFLICVFKRTYVFFEEIFHYKTRYKGSIQHIVQICFGDRYFVHFLLLYMFYLFMMLIVLYILPMLSPLPWSYAVKLKSSFDQPSVNTNASLHEYIFFIIFVALFFASWETCSSQWFGKSNAHANAQLKAGPSMGSLWANAACRSYFKPVTENIRERIYEFEKQHSVTIPVKKLVIIIPLSCDVRGTIDTHNQNIRYVGNLPAIITDQGANVNRKYLNPVYEVTFPSEKPLYIAMEQPSSILTLWKMRKTIAPEILRYQASVFITLLREELKDSDCVILEYDDGKESLCDVLKRNIDQILVEDRDKCQLTMP